MKSLSKNSIFNILILLALAFGALGVTPVQAAPQAALAADLVTAFAENPADIVSASYIHQANASTTAVFSSPSTLFPTGSDSSFIGMSSGAAANMPTPGASTDASYGDSYNGVRDVTALKIDLLAPAGVDCLQFDVQFFSQEYPQYIGSSYNDAFVAELDTSDWSVSGTTINAPHNFALAPGNKVLSINSGLTWSPALANGTAFVSPHGGTAVYTVSTPTVEGAHSLYLTVWDMGDNSLDSAVYLDGLRMFDSSGSCQSGVVVPSAPTITGIAPNSGPVAGGTSVVITGQNLTNGAVTFGGTPASCTVDSDTQITCTSPAHAAGAVNVVVSAPGGSATQVGGFTYVAQPVVMVTADDQTITYGAGDPAFTFTSNPSITFDTNPVCGVSAAHSDAGSYTISCSGGSASGYTISYVDGALTVNKATLTVTANDQTMISGDPDPAFTFGYTGFVGLDDAADLDTAPVCSVAAPHTVPGQYPITCSGGSDNNYDFAYVPGTLTVQPAVYSVTLNSVAAWDGWVIESSANSGVGSTPLADYQLRVGDDLANRQSRSYLHFNTSSLPDNAIITSVTLKLKWMADHGSSDPFAAFGNLAVDIKDQPFSNDRVLQSSDFQDIPSKCSVGYIPNTPAAGWYSVNLTTTSYARINLTGATQFRLRFPKGSNFDGIADWVQFYSGNAAPADQPQLIIEYVIPSSLPN